MTQFLKSTFLRAFVATAVIALVIGVFSLAAQASGGVNLYNVTSETMTSEVIEALNKTKGTCQCGIEDEPVGNLLFPMTGKCGNVEDQRKAAVLACANANFDQLGCENSVVCRKLSDEDAITFFLNPEFDIENGFGDGFGGSTRQPNY